MYDDDTVRFVLYMENDYYEDIKADMSEFEKRFKLTTSWKLSNMTCFDTQMRIVKFSTVGDMLKALIKNNLPPISDPSFPDTVDAYEYLLKAPL